MNKKCVVCDASFNSNGNIIIIGMMIFKLYSCVSKVIQVQSFSTCIPDTFLICVLKFKKIKLEWKKFFVRHRKKCSRQAISFILHFKGHLQSIRLIIIVFTYIRITREKILQFFYYSKSLLFIVQFFIIMTFFLQNFCHIRLFLSRWIKFC